MLFKVRVGVVSALVLIQIGLVFGCGSWDILVRINKLSKSTLNQITEHVYWFSPDETTDRPTLGAIVGKRATLVVDAGNSPAHAQLFLNELAKIEIASPSYLVLTHWHWDHLFGVDAFNALICASQETKRVVEEMAAWDWSDAALDKRVKAGIEIEFCRDMIKKEMPDRTSLRLKIPDVAFVKQIDIDLGDISCQVIHVGGDHAEDSTVVYIPQDNVLFLSDCLYPDLHHGAWHYTVEKLFPLLDKILSFQAEFYLFGHGEVLMPLADMVTFATLLKTVGQKVAEIGDNRERILLDLHGTLDKPLNEEHFEIVDAFLAGL